jgi:transposase
MTGKRIPLEIRTEIATLYAAKVFSMSQLASKFKVSKHAVHDIVHKKKEFGTIADRPRSGRPKITSTADDRALCRMARANPRLSAPELQRLWLAKASVSTVKARLRSNGLHGYIARRKPMLTPLHHRRRLQWCRERKHWSVQQWRRVLFTDESSFSLIPNSTRVYIRRRINEEFRPQCLAPSYKTRSPTVMVWGGISGAGTGPLFLCEGRVNQHAYRNMLQHHLSYLRTGIFMQDNAPCHSTQMVLKWLQEQRIQTLPWPALSPDLNPIEHIWGIMKRRIQGMQFKKKIIIIIIIINHIPA